MDCCAESINMGKRMMSPIKRTIIFETSENLKNSADRHPIRVLTTHAPERKLVPRC